MPNAFNDTQLGKFREWLNTMVMVGVLLFGVGQWAGFIQFGSSDLTRRLSDQQKQIDQLQQQIQDLRAIGGGQNTQIAVLQYQATQIKEQLDSISRTIGARVVP